MDDTITQPAGQALNGLDGFRNRLIDGHLIIDFTPHMRWSAWTARYGPLTCYSSTSPFDAAARLLDGAAAMLDRQQESKWTGKERL